MECPTHAQNAPDSCMMLTKHRSEHWPGGVTMSSDGQRQGESSSLMPVSEDPVCRESSLPALTTWVTPTDRYFIRHHFADVPRGDRATWHLVIDGEVRRPFTLSFADMLALPSHEV